MDKSNKKNRRSGAGTVRKRSQSNNENLVQSKAKSRVLRRPENKKTATVRKTGSVMLNATTPLKGKKEEKDAPLKSIDLDEEDVVVTATTPSNMGPPLLVKEKEQPVVEPPKKKKWLGEEAAKLFVNKCINIDKMKQEFLFLDSIACVKPSTAFAANKERNRDTKNVVFDENRVILNRPGMEDTNYINASTISVKDFPNKFIIAQMPKLEHESFVEDFWYMIHQEQITLMFMLCSEEVTKNAPTKLLKEEAGEFQNLGQMFINTRKAEKKDELRFFAMEVLPAGCSDAIMCQVEQNIAWPMDRPPEKLRLVIKMIHRFLSETAIENSNVCVVSLNGSGRACSFLASLIAVAQLNKGVEPNVMEILKTLKLQRQGATENFVQYLAIYEIVLSYIQRKVSDKEFKQRVNETMKMLINGDYTIDDQQQLIR